MTTTELNAVECLQHAKQILDEVTHRLIHQGYYAPPDYTGLKDKDILIPEVTLRKFARRVAKEYKRPFVQLKFEGKWYKGAWTTHLIVEVPKRHYTAPLVNPLLLVASDVYNSDVYVNKRFTSLWAFQIADMEFAKQYLEYFDTRDEFRAALKLPPKVTNITSLKEAA